MSQNLNRLCTQLVLLKYAFTPVRHYARWMNRNPAKVILPFEPTSKPNLKKEKIINLDAEVLSKSHKENKPKIAKIEEEAKPDNKKLFSTEQSNKIKSKREEALKKQKFYLSQKKVFDDNNEIIFEKLKENDSRISSLLVKLKSKKDRVRLNQVLVEGWRLIVDGLDAKCKLKYVIFSRKDDLNNLRPFLPNTGVKFYKVPYNEIQLWSDVETSPGILGVFEMPAPENVKRLARPLPMDFICDNIRVPGNLGAILRVAVGAGCNKVLLTKGCVDLWDSKVLRSAAGAHFRLPVYSSVEWEDMSNHLEKDSSIFIADSNAEVIESDKIKIDGSQNVSIPVLPYYGVQYSNIDHITMIIGGETEGISDESYALAVSKNGLRLNIPLQKGIDSLNTGMAAAVIAFEIRKQFIEAWTRAKLERQVANAT